MSISETDPNEVTYPLRTAARLTGLSPGLLRAWEKRHRVVEPRRTPGGTRRYTAANLDRLRLVKAAVDAGHRIGQVAQLEVDELKRKSQVTESGAAGHLDDILWALGRLDGADCQRLLSLQLSMLGPTRFARDIALPLVAEIGGERWANRQLGISQEHLASAVLRTLLGSALVPTASSLAGPRIVFATLTGERHELGLLMAALTSLAAGANPLYLGVEMPVDDLVGAVVETNAAVLGLSLVIHSTAQASRAVSELRDRLASGVHLWLGGAASRDLIVSSAIEQIDDLEKLEQRVMLLRFANAP